ncbi:MAG TPA: TlpA disulfide reductase family protein [Mycobacteriales bacterium]|nr:TlpA disulfide reductase family protein [Mycobacteriales bacterium]
MSVTLIDVDGGEYRLAGSLTAVDAADLTAATGWALKPEGLCRGEVCVPLLGRVVATSDAAIDLAAWASTLGHHYAVDAEREVLALAAATSAAALEVGTQAPDVELPDVDGNLHALSDLAGRKRVLVTWASWCGCRYELGAWRDLQDELAPAGLSVYSVALDNSADDARPWVEAADPSYPVVVDSAHVVAERYAITNVPSTVWIDEAGRIVKPPTISPGDDQFRDFTKIDAAVHHEALRRWVNDGELPETGGSVDTRTPDEQLAQAERRLGAWLHNRGETEAAKAHLDRAVELAPWDWTVRRASIALRGDDPFLGEEFTTFWQQWDDAGRPGYVGMA